jgi:hypothetical protein
MSIFGWLKHAPSARADSGTFRPLRFTDALRPSEYRGDGGRYMSEPLADTDADERADRGRVGGRRMTTEGRDQPGGIEWHSHHPLLPQSEGDFTPVTADEHHGDLHPVPGPLAELLSRLTPAEPEREVGA